MQDSLGREHCLLRESEQNASFLDTLADEESKSSFHGFRKRMKCFRRSREREFRIIEMIELKDLEVRL